jgi:DnaJ-class molecular chaperone
MRDPYQVLGIQKNADAAAIKSAFRKLAKKLHPDANKTDPKASTRFSELNSAYEILGDEAKRKQFDAGEIDAEGKPRFTGFGGQPGGGGFSPGGGFGHQGGGFSQPGGGYGPETVFETFSFGPEGVRRSGTRGQAGNASPGGSFEDILKDMFGGGGGVNAGAAQSRRTGFGGGFRTEDYASPAGRDVQASVNVTLAQIAGGAKLRVRLPTGKDVDVKVPVGLSDGQQIRLKGQGLPGPGGEGDALITVNILPDARFTRDGNDLRLELPVTLYEAVLGAKVRVPTIQGAVSLAVPAGTSSGRVFRLKGKGMPTKAGAGDLLATIRIVLPPHKDEQLEELMKAWRDSKQYDPRKDLDEA